MLACTTLQFLMHASMSTHLKQDRRQPILERNTKLPVPQCMFTGREQTLSHSYFCHDLFCLV